MLSDLPPCATSASGKLANNASNAVWDTPLPSMVTPFTSLESSEYDMVADSDSLDLP